jgi:hypothetical protein
MRVAIEHEASAKLARAQLVREYTATREFGEAMNEELHASMVAITASAFALDGFYGTVLQWIQLPEELLAAWSENHTARHARIFETLKRGFNIGRRSGSWPGELKWLFSYRDANVHFEEIFRDAYEAKHPVVPGVTWERVAFSVESASRAVDLALDVVKTCVQSAPRNERLAEVPRRFGGLVRQYDELRLVHEPNA